jgi:hypothetical protein
MIQIRWLQGWRILWENHHKQVNLFQTYPHTYASVTGMKWELVVRENNRMLTPMW